MPIRRRTRHAPPSSRAELNLAPMMNMVMILIPMLALMAVFVRAGVISLSSPRPPSAAVTPAPEQDPVPRVVVAVSQDGFRITDLRNTPGFEVYAAPIAGCPQSTHRSTPAATVCLRDGVTAETPLVEALDFASLYNRLVAIRLDPRWYDGFAEEGGAISLTTDGETPYEVVIATMDAARYFIDTGTPPTATTDPSALYVSGRERGDVADFAQATHLQRDARYVDLFPAPVLVLPRPGA